MSFSPDQLAEFREVFSLFDKGNDTIAAHDLGTVIRALGRAPTEAQLNDLLKNNPGGQSVNFDTLCQIMGTRLEGEQESEDDIVEAFRVFDKDGQGTISLGELTHVLTNLGEKLSEEDVEELLKEAGMRSDTIDYRSFTKIILGQ
mmetsp:Transcript_35315/g.80687  ORF Transcript_35315/g.80687 Transcript_35315/m.80687 type:complete len:145 (-) Transcript_35315:60-494(-)